MLLKSTFLQFSTSLLESPPVEVGEAQSAMSTGVPPLCHIRWELGPGGPRAPEGSWDPKWQWGFQMGARSLEFGLEKLYQI